MWHFNRHEYPAAVNFFMKSLINKPDYHLARIWIGKAYYFGGYPMNANKEWNRVLELEPDNFYLRNKINNLQYIQSLSENDTLDCEYTDLFSYKPPTIEKNSIPVAIYSDSHNNSYVVDYNNQRVYKYNANGKLIQQIPEDLDWWDSLWSFFSEESKEMGNFKDLYIAKDKLYLTNYMDDQIFIFSKDGNVINKITIDEEDNINTKIQGPWGICLDENKNIYVINSGRNELLRWSSNGEFISYFKIHGENKFKKGFYTNLAYHNKTLYIVDVKNKLIHLYDIEGNYLDSIGKDVLKHPISVKYINDQNNLLVTDKKAGIFTYSLENNTWLNLVKNTKDHPITPIDSTIASNGNLLFIEEGSPEIKVNVPVKLKYSSLFLDTLQTYVKKFPYVYFKVALNNRIGQDLKGLTIDNFKIFEDGIETSKKELKPFQPKHNQMSIAVIADKSEEMLTYKNRLEKLLRTTLKDVSKHDEMEIIYDYHSDVDVAFVNRKTDSDLLIPLHNLINNQTYEGKDIGHAFYRGVSDLLRRENKYQRILIINSGNIVEDDFEPYGIDECIHFAKVNMVPVFAISMTDKPGNEILKKLCEGTGGKFYIENQDSSITDIFTDMRKIKNNLYYLSYRAKHNRTIHPELRNIEIQIDYHGISGTDKVEYFTPKGIQH